jgi:anti-sigma factor RsiW
LAWFNDSPFSEDDLHDLVAVADGSLPPERQADVLARVDASSALSAALERQRRAVAAIRAAAISAPPGLRARVEAERRPTRPLSWPIGRLLIPAGVATAAAALLVVVLLLAGGPARAPAVNEIADLGARPSLAPPASADPVRPALLTLRAAGLPFPNLRTLEWRVVGAREDAVRGRPTTTAFYERHGRRIAYTIVSGHALEPPDGGRRIVRSGITFVGFERGGRQVITWTRRGHTCVLSGPGTRQAALLKLASWTGKGSIPS